MSKRSEDVTTALLFAAVFASGLTVGIFGWLGVLIATVAAVTYGIGFRVGDM